MISVFTSIEVDNGFEPRSDETKDYKTLLSIQYKGARE